MLFPGKENTMNKTTDTVYNYAVAEGVIASEPVYSHQVLGERFYQTVLKTERLSTITDNIPVLISERLTEIESLMTGLRVVVRGQFRSFNWNRKNENRLILFLFVREIEYLSEEDEKFATNQIYLDGYICKTPCYRRTPLGREIADVMMAVNRAYGKSDYLPCVFWGRNARYAADLNVGDRLQIFGRMQSRRYRKHDGDTYIMKEAYEISVDRMEYIQESAEVTERVAQPDGKRG